MHLALKGGIALALLASAGTTAAPSYASTVVNCISVGTATFSPRLTSAFQTGEITLDSYTCAVVNSEGSSGTATGTYSFGYAYSGNCVTATVGNSDTTGLLVGGVAATLVSTPPSGAVGALAMSFTPIDSLGNPCDMGTALFVAEGPAIFP